MSFTFGKTSIGRLRGVHPAMVAVVLLALRKSPQDFSVLEGVRTEQRQRLLYAQGRTTPGDVVTWTLNSPHIPKDDGYGHAVDLTPYPLDWKDTAAFDRVAQAMFAAAEELGVKIRWGADWDSDGNPRERGESDSPHFELEGA
jgi:peptidoglycan L-alanyl-D-glutamate endopeptidase CwlK